MSVSNVIPSRGSSSVIPPYLRRHLISSSFIALLFTLLCVIFLYGSRSPSEILRSTKSPIDPIRLSDPSTLSASGSKPEASRITLPDLPEDPYAEHFPNLRLPDSLLEYPLLAQKLYDFLVRPISNYTSEYVLEQHLLCPPRLSDNLVNPDQYKGERDSWLEISAREIAYRRAVVVNWLENRLLRGEPIVGTESTGLGRGIVLAGGNKDTTFRMISVMRHLKKLNVELPIEVFHYDDELQDRDQRREINELGAEMISISSSIKVRGSWKIKGLAMVQSTFREVIYLDSDNIPLRDPTHLFSAPTYLDRGRAVFWPDITKDHPDNAIWRVMGDRCNLDHWTFESGIIVIDKAGNDGLNFAALVIASEMQGARDFWFKMSGGDKDTFRWGFRTLGLDWGEPPRWMSTVGFLNRFENGRFCGHTMLQHDLVVPDGLTRAPPLFMHSNLLKHVGAVGLGRGTTFTHLKRVSTDDIYNPILNHAHMYVYQGVVRGMCMDMDWHDSTDEERGGASIETVELGDVEGDVFNGFETAFFDEGGRVGGW